MQQNDPHSHFRAFLLTSSCLLWWLTGCQDSTSVRECEPGQQRGCPTNQHCILDGVSAPKCTPISSDPLSFGAACLESSECAQGSGCAALFGEARCVPFCEADQAMESADLPCENLLGPGARCLFNLPSRPEIGLCIAPCQPTPLDSDEQECKGGDFCTLHSSLPFMTCSPPGSALEGELCGDQLRCGAGLSCVQQGGIARCQSIWLGSLQDERSRCEIGQLATLHTGARDPLSGAGYLSCWDDYSLITNLSNQLTYRISLPTSTYEESRERCANISGTTLSNLSDLSSLSDRVRGDLHETIQIVIQRSGLIVPGVWVRRPPNENTCLRLDLISGNLEPTPCQLNLPSLCEILPTSL